MDFLGLSIVIGVGWSGIGDPGAQVKPVDEIGLSLVKVNGARVYLKKSDAAFYGLEK